LAALVLQLAGTRVPVLGRGWATLDRRYWPVELLPELRAYEREHSQGMPIFNELLFGGFLIYHTPGLRVFIDDRCELYGDEGLLAYAEALERDPARVDRWANDYGFDLALAATGSGFDRYLRQARGWTLVRETVAASLYRRLSSPRASRGSNPLASPEGAESNQRGASPGTPSNLDLGIGRVPRS
jgi:hypothetical protein